MAEILLFPRLPLHPARLHLQHIKGRTATELSSLVTTCPLQAVYAATGGARIKSEVLSEVREYLLRSATQLGFPDRYAGESTKFDVEAAAILFEHLPILPCEACRDEVWSFICIRLLPDLTTWRFPDQNDRRFLGGVRNAFQRLWWRAFLLRDDEAHDPWWLVRLPEDALVGLMERPGISSNRAVACSIARAVARLAKSLPPGLREEGWRIAYKLIRQRIPLVNLDAIPEADLTEQLNRLCEIACAMVRYAGVTVRATR
jgi:hypothetical protein